VVCEEVVFVKGDVIDLEVFCLWSIEFLYGLKIWKFHEAESIEVSLNE